MTCLAHAAPATLPVTVLSTTCRHLSSGRPWWARNQECQLQAMHSRCAFYLWGFGSFIQGLPVHSAFLLCGPTIVCITPTSQVSSHQQPLSDRHIAIQIDPVDCSSEAFGGIKVPFNHSEPTEFLHAALNPMQSQTSPPECTRQSPQMSMPQTHQTRSPQFPDGQRDSVPYRPQPPMLPLRTSLPARPQHAKGLQQHQCHASAWRQASEWQLSTQDRSHSWDDFLQELPRPQSEPSRARYSQSVASSICARLWIMLPEQHTLRV